MLVDTELKEDFIKTEIEEIISLMDNFIVNSDFYKDAPRDLLSKLKEKAQKLLRVIK